MRGRVGIRLGKDWNLGDEQRPRLLTTWLCTDLWHEFRGDNSVTEAAFDGTPLRYIPSSLGGTWGETGGDVSGQITDDVTLFGTTVSSTTPAARPGMAGSA